MRHELLQQFKEQLENNKKHYADWQIPDTAVYTTANIKNKAEAVLLGGDRFRWYEIQQPVVQNNRGGMAVTAEVIRNLLEEVDYATEIIFGCEPTAIRADEDGAWATWQLEYDYSDKSRDTAVKWLTDNAQKIVRQEVLRMAQRNKIQGINYQDQRLEDALVGLQNVAHFDPRAPILPPGEVQQRRAPQINAADFGIADPFGVHGAGRIQMWIDEHVPQRAAMPPNQAQPRPAAEPGVPAPPPNWYRRGGFRQPGEL